MTYFDDGDVRLYCADALEALRELPDQSVHMACTSPPFFGLRDYGTGTWEGGDEGCEHDAAPTAEHAENRERAAILQAQGRDKSNRNPLGPGQHGGWEGRSFRSDGSSLCRCGARRTDGQIGLESSPDEWAARLVDVFREVRRVLRDDGTLWVECGDSYAQKSDRVDSAEYAQQVARFSSEEERRKKGNNRNPYARGKEGRDRCANSLSPGLKPKDLIGQPWLLATKMRDPYYTGRIKDERDRIWLAAIVEGEGCIHIHKRKAGDASHAKFTRKDGTEAEYVRKNDTYGVMISVSNTDKSIIERCRAITGYGGVTESRPKGTRNQMQWRWAITGQQSREVLRELYPHLMGKARQARIAIACPSSDAGKFHEAIKDLHNGRGADFDVKPPEALYEPGWYLRSCIVWGKSNAMPESVTDRPTTAHSYVFLFSKRPRYFYDAESLREAHDDPARGLRGAPHAGQLVDGESLNNGRESAPRKESSNPHAWKDAELGTTWVPAERAYNPAGKNARSVWNIPTEPNALAICRVCDAFWQGGAPREHCGQPVVQHFAAFPRELVRRMILAGSAEGDTVLDPFAGSGTTGLVARQQGRNAILIELNERYAAMCKARMSQLSLLAQ